METSAGIRQVKPYIYTPSSLNCSRSGSPDRSATPRLPKHQRQNSEGCLLSSNNIFSFPEFTESAESHQLQKPFFVIVAIDFGTTYSGYAFSFVKDPESLHIMRKWEGGDPGLVNQKTLTTLLLNPDGEFHSFGFTARDNYHDLDQSQAKKWFYFEKFKMALHHNSELNKNTTINASNGQAYPALKVFVHSLKYFKDHALQELTDQSETSILNEDIRWVITVPAIWKAPAKQFMRQAAYMAGLASPSYPGQLLIALEPEAASIYVRKLRTYQLIPETFANNNNINNNNTNNTDNINNNNNSNTLSSSISGGEKGNQLHGSTRYMVVDCGGGTVDITVHEMEENGGCLRELHRATGGPYGSIGIDHEFEKLLCNIFSPEFMNSFKLKRPTGWVDLMTSFEARKRSAHPNKCTPLNVALPFSFIEYYKKFKGSQVETAIKKHGGKDITWSSQGMLRLNPEVMRWLFAPTLDKIKQSIGDVLNNQSVRGIRYIFLVGGFAESGLLQFELKKDFGHLLKIIIPQDVSTTILKGAVCFGLDPTVVSVRKCRLTYGVGVLNRFVPGVHPEANVVVKDGVRWCRDVLDKFVVVDQPVALGDTVVRSYAPAKIGQRTCVVHIYCTERPDALLVSDQGVRRCGTLCLDLSEDLYRQHPSGMPYHKSRRSREIQTTMIFGDTEIKVSAVDVHTGKCVRSVIDFLGR
ncbi:hypothetical protein HELRODRAFT_102816 [Helobdella robusta]|uniref:Heat shock 70 kDa protein 12A n=1 Tax=Helobdella robusta TaxID=6412 RepID=T1EDC1_HELRO|nr:hypothetical protein HELRODRAFT_102816 [Helobdella robusta]ESN95006.1 hypothetical protein HELRODRAFT_102816 [Helobdella robusta]